MKSIKTTLKCSKCASKLSRFTDSGYLWCWTCETNTKDDQTPNKTSSSLHKSEITSRTVYKPFELDYTLPIVADSWRGINMKTMKALGVQQTRERINNGWHDLYHFKINIKGSERGAFNMLVTPTEELKYLMETGTRDVVWPLDYVTSTFAQSKTLYNGTQKAYVVLVEGQRDALRLIENGIPALCIFGASKFNSKIAELIAEKFNRVVIALDGDEAGKAGTAKIFELLEPFKKSDDVLAIYFDCGDGKDPMSMNAEKLQELKALTTPEK